MQLPEQEYFQITRYDMITEVMRNHQTLSNVHDVTVSVFRTYGTLQLTYDGPVLPRQS